LVARESVHPEICSGCVFLFLFILYNIINDIKIIKKTKDITAIKNKNNKNEIVIFY
tara:strand:+ start:93 stop:260 length:168 start_codon:yes stop_codon:yes gene_type:complete